MSKKQIFSEEELFNLCTSDFELYDESFDEFSDSDLKRNLSARRQVEELLERKRLFTEINDLLDDS